jgi:hypothetical protein
MAIISSCCMLIHLCCTSDGGAGVAVGAWRCAHGEGIEIELLRYLCQRPQVVEAVLRHEPRTAHDDRPIPSTFVRRTTMKITRGLSTRSQGHGAGAHSRVPAPVASDAIATFSGSDSSSCRVENAKNEPGNFSASSRIVATSFASKASRPKLFDSPKTRTGKSSRSKSVSLWYQHAKSISRFVCASNLMSIPVE